MASEKDCSQHIVSQIREAIDAKCSLQIRGGGSKDFLGRCKQGQVLDISEHYGVVDYEPSELVITARAGTLLSTLESVLADAGQMLPFEPPHFAASATVGGMVASGLSGPRRPFAGAVRDAVLGIRCINGKAEELRFGGQVVKNVAGYDVSRLMTGAMGTLGVLLEVSLKVIPRPRSELTLVQEVDSQTAIKHMNTWAGKSLGLSAAAYIDDKLYIRLSGYDAGIKAARQKIGGDIYPTGQDLWQGLREHTLSFFADTRPLWRVSLPPATEPISSSDKELLDWGGAQRWIKTDVEPEVIQKIANAHGGYATLFRSYEDNNDVFQILPDSLLKIHQRLKHAFDPDSIFNIGRLYPEAKETTI